MKKILIAVACTFLLAVSVWAGGRVMHRHGGPGGHGGIDARIVHHLTEGLNLTDDQKATARELHEELMAKARPVMEQQKDLWSDLHGLLEADKPNATEIGEKAIAIHAGRKQIKAIHEDGMNRFSAILTAEQRAEFEKRREGLEERMHGFGRMGFPEH